MKKNLTNKKKNEKGFTLVELIVVIAIIGVLVAMMVPSLIGYVNKAKVQKNNANARTIASTVQASNAALTKPVKGTAADKLAIIKVEGNVWNIPGDEAGAIDPDDKTESKPLAKEFGAMITVDGSAYIEIDNTGKVIKVIYFADKNTVPEDVTGAVPDDTTGVWEQ